MPVSKQPLTKPYGLWSSPTSIESIFNQPAIPAYPFRHSGNLYWLQALAEQQGRIALMTLVDGKLTCLTPTDFNIRTRVHEYGGRCFCQHGDSIVFNNFDDGRLYRQQLTLGSQPQPLTSHDKSVIGYADLVSVSTADHIIAVHERAGVDRVNENSIISICLNGEASDPVELVSGSDFYASPVISPDCARLAWFEWDQPYMPWDQSRLCLASLAISPVRISCRDIQSLIDEPDCSVCQPGFLDDGSLVFASDSERNEWWNLYRWDPSYAAGSIVQITNESTEFGEAHWVFGQCRWRQINTSELLAIGSDHDGDTLWRISLSGPPKAVQIVRFASLSQLSFSDGKCLMVGLPEEQPGRIYQLDSSCNQPQPLPVELNCVVSPGYSRPESFSCETRDGEFTRGYFYPPYSAEFAAPEESLPPLMVMIHGGPTGRTNTAYHPLRQYFASLGFAILDINHRGSTGYGRKYRQRLLGEWGQVDTMDIADCIDYLVDRGRINPAAIFIRGSSAGGYAVLRALTRYPDRFAGGACYYGIGNLITLAEITHKFEGKYTDRLIGEWYDPIMSKKSESRYVKRSPIFDMDNLKAPLILFQGCDDKVVPPEVSREVVQKLEQKGIRYGYTEYPGEGHGFRKTATRIDSLEKETDFFVEIIEDLNR